MDKYNLSPFTHFDDDAGNGSAIVIMLCRYLLEGKSFDDAETLISNNKDLKESWTKLQNAKLKSDGYVYNVIFSALHFIVYVCVVLQLRLCINLLIC